jgi:hypothetical protein
MSKKHIFKLDAIGGNDLDCVEAFVVRAESEQIARLMASLQPGDEGSEFWRDPARSSCEVITEIGLQEIIIRHFRPA